VPPAPFPQASSGLLHSRTSIDGKTALILACRGDNPDVVQYLLDAGADLEQQDSFGLTALWLAICDSKEEVRTWLAGGGHGLFVIIDWFPSILFARSKL
jgi:hypothetical protein